MANNPFGEDPLIQIGAAMEFWTGIRREVFAAMIRAQDKSNNRPEEAKAKDACAAADALVEQLGK